MDTNMASLDKALQIWVKRFSEYLAYEISHKSDFFVYSSSFIFQILDFLYWIVCNSIFDGVTVKTENCLFARDLHSQFLLGLIGFFFIQMAHFQKFN